MAIVKLWSRSRWLFVVVLILVAFTVGNAVWAAVDPRWFSPASMLIDGMAAGAVLGITATARILRS